MVGAKKRKGKESSPGTWGPESSKLNRDGKKQTEEGPGPGFG